MSRKQRTKDIEAVLPFGLRREDAVEVNVKLWHKAPFVVKVTAVVVAVLVFGMALAVVFAMGQAIGPKRCIDIIAGLLFGSVLALLVVALWRLPR